MIVFVFQQGQETFLDHIFELDFFRNHLFWLHPARADRLEDFIKISKDIRSDTLSFISGVGRDPIENTNLVRSLSEDKLVRNDSRVFLPEVDSQQELFQGMHIRKTKSPSRTCGIEWSVVTPECV